MRDRPIIGTIVKPALGLRPHETAEMVRELVDADVDFIKDDEKLMSPAYSSLADRVKAIMPIILDREQKTGKKVMYAFGISHADPEIDACATTISSPNAGGNAAVININSIGYGGFAYLRKRSRLVLHAHRNGWDILTRHPGLGLDFSVYQQFWRLLGVDQFQINGIGAKYWEPDESFVRSFEALQDAAVLAERLAVAGRRLRPMGRPGAGDFRAHGPNAGSALSLRRRRRQPSRRPGGGRARGAAGLGGGGRRHRRWTFTRASIANSRNPSPNSAGGKAAHEPVSSRLMPELLAFLLWRRSDGLDRRHGGAGVARRADGSVHRSADAGAAREFRRCPRDRPCRGRAAARRPAWMDEHLTPALAWLKSLGAVFCHYKVCSTFDSSPTVGSIGRALEIGQASVRAAMSSPLVVGAPQLKRYTAFGHLFAAYQGQIYRIDRHPVMARHPVTPMDEADLRLHLGRQTNKRIGLVDVAALAGEGVDPAR